MPMSVRPAASVGGAPNERLCAGSIDLGAVLPLRRLGVRRARASGDRRAPAARSGHPTGPPLVSGCATGRPARAHRVGPRVVDGGEGHAKRDETVMAKMSGVRKARAPEFLQVTRACVIRVACDSASPDAAIARSAGLSPSSSPRRTRPRAAGRAARPAWLPGEPAVGMAQSGSARGHQDATLPFRERPCRGHLGHQVKQLAQRPPLVCPQPAQPIWMPRPAIQRNRESEPWTCRVPRALPAGQAGRRNTAALTAPAPRRNRMMHRIQPRALGLHVL